MLLFSQYQLSTTQEFLLEIVAEAYEYYAIVKQSMSVFCSASVSQKN